MFTNQSKQQLITELRSTFEKNFTRDDNDELKVKSNDDRHFFINAAANDLQTRIRIDSLTKELASFGMKYDEAKHIVRFEGLGSHDDMVFSLALAVYLAKGVGLVNYTVRRSSYALGGKRRRSIARRTN